jgi:arylsulfatase A-like enzyme
MKIFIFYICILSTCFCSAYSADRPNILFAFADDWGQHASIYAKVNGAGGVNDLIRTPNFDKIAEEGVLFRNAFVSSPSCTPCRSSLLSGRHFWQTGRASILQGAIWDGSNPAYPLIMKEKGYHIGQTYKVWSPGAPVDAPYGEKHHAYEKSGQRFNRFSQDVTKLMNQDKTLAQAKEVLYDEVRENFKAFLKDKQDGSPFCYWFGPTNVHRKWIKGSGKTLWNLNPDDLKGKMPAFLPDVQAVREDLADYFGEVMAFDAALGVLLEELKKAGQYENTIIAISGDHGAPGFPQGKCNLYDFGSKVALAVSGPGVVKGRVLNDFVSLPDLAPTFLEAGSIQIPDAMSAKSLWPSLSSPKDKMADPSRTQVYIGRERHVAVAREGYLPYPQRAIRTEDHLFIINFKPERYPMGDPYMLGTENEPNVDTLTNTTFVTLPDEDAGPTKAWLVKHRVEWHEVYHNAYGKRPREELYDLKKDPDQMNNVAGKKGYQKVQAQLREKLLAEMRNTQDPRLINDGEFFETEPMSGPTGPWKMPTKKK